MASDPAEYQAQMAAQVHTAAVPAARPAKPRVYKRGDRWFADFPPVPGCIVYVGLWSYPTWPQVMQAVRRWYRFGNPMGIGAALQMRGIHL